MSTERPISPHLQIYRKQITSVLSITHRVSGLILIVGAVLLAYWLIALATGPEAFADANAVLGSFLGRVALFGFTLAFFYHLANGVRHLFWDVGWGFDLATVYKSGYAAIGAAVVLPIWAARALYRRLSR